MQIEAADPNLNCSAFHAVANVMLINNTIANNTLVGVHNLFSLEPIYGDIELYNNLFLNNKIGFDYLQTGMTSAWSHNAYWLNTTNVADKATAGAGDVTTDPLVNLSTTPPTLTSSSPLRGAGDVTRAPALDFFAHPRNGRADIGAAEGP